MLEDIRSFDSVKNALEIGEEELIPASVVNALAEGENPIKVWREYRDTLHALKGGSFLGHARRIRPR